MVCSACQENPVAPGRRKYCTECGAHASVLWKRRQRRAWKRLGQKYWRDNWKHTSDEERCAYFRQYMRAYRRKQPGSTGSLNARKQPFDALTVSLRNSQQHLGSDFTSSFLVPRELALTDSQLAGEVPLGDIESSEFSESPSDGSPVNGNGLGTGCHQDSS